VLACAWYLTRPTPVDEAEVRAYADLIAENLLNALKEGDYGNFIKDMGDVMRQALDEEAFTQLKGTLDSKIGEYVSASYGAAEMKDNLITVTYKARFTGETSDVVVRIVFQETGGVQKITGPWFDSPKLRS